MASSSWQPPLAGRRSSHSWSSCPGTWGSPKHPCHPPDWPVLSKHPTASRQKQPSLWHFHALSASCWPPIWSCPSATLHEVVDVSDGHRAGAGPSAGFDTSLSAPVEAVSCPLPLAPRTSVPRRGMSSSRRGALGSMAISPAGGRFDPKPCFRFQVSSCAEGFWRLLRLSTVFCPWSRKPLFVNRISEPHLARHQVQLPIPSRLAAAPRALAPVESEALNVRHFCKPYISPEAWCDDRTWGRSYTFSGPTCAALGTEFRKAYFYLGALLSPVLLWFSQQGWQEAPKRRASHHTRIV